MFLKRPTFYKIFSDPNFNDLDRETKKFILKGVRDTLYSFWILDELNKVLVTKEKSFVELFLEYWVLPCVMITAVLFLPVLIVVGSIIHGPGSYVSGTIYISLVVSFILAHFVHAEMFLKLDKILWFRWFYARGQEFEGLMKVADHLQGIRSTIPFTVYFKCYRTTVEKYLTELEKGIDIKNARKMYTESTVSSSKIAKFLKELENLIESTTNTGSGYNIYSPFTAGDNRYGTDTTFFTNADNQIIDYFINELSPLREKNRKSDFEDILINRLMDINPNGLLSLKTFKHCKDDVTYIKSALESLKRCYQMLIISKKNDGNVKKEILKSRIEIIDKAIVAATATHGQLVAGEHKLLVDNNLTKLKQLHNLVESKGGSR